MSELLETWSEPEIGEHLISGYRYTSRDFMEQEWEGMWTKVWLLLGREAELPNPGDWQMEEVGREEVLMVRQDDGGVKAFYNICQHRGNPLVDDPKGSIRQRFVCKYHSWAFLPDGSLHFAPDRDDFPQGNPCDHVRLQELRCETFAGFIWVNMDPNCISLQEFLGPIWDEWERREIAKWKRTMANTAWMPCNWKIVMDNFNESYHVPTVHMRTKPGSDRKKIVGNVNTYYKETRFDLSEEGHNRMVMKGGYAAGRTDDDGRIQEPLASLLRYWELDPEDFTGRPEDTRDALQQAKRKLGPERGYTHYAKVPADQLTDAFHYTLFPNFAASVWSDGFHFLRVRPHRDDPEQCLFDNWWYSSPASLEEPMTLARSHDKAEMDESTGEAKLRWINFPEESIGPAIEEDVEVFLTQQRGFRSRGFKGVYLSNQEKRIRRYHELIDSYITRHLGSVSER